MHTAFAWGLAFAALPIPSCRVHMPAIPASRQDPHRAPAPQLALSLVSTGVLLFSLAFSPRVSRALWQWQLPCPRAPRRVILKQLPVATRAHMPWVVSSAAAGPFPCMATCAWLQLKSAEDHVPPAGS